MIFKSCSIIAFSGLVLFLWTNNNLLGNEDPTESSLVGNETNSRILSRRKRFLVFPDGSSFQLVFCVQTAALIAIGDIFLYSSTVALAWNLPTDPNFLRIFKPYEQTAQRRGDDKHIYYVNEKGKFLARVPYRRRVIVNPAFAKRSVDEKITIKEKIDRAKMHEGQSKRDFLKEEHLDSSVEFHRSSRVELYEKLVPLIDTVISVTPVFSLGGDGRQCVLYKLCESARIARQGTFLQELLRVVFTLPKGEELADEFYRDFDKAHNATEDCLTLYPGCGRKTENIS